MRTKKGRIVLVTLFAVLSLSTIALAVNCPIPDTGQTKCYNNAQEITCSSPGEDFYGQDAQYITNPQSYTKLDANGNDLPVEATEWVMVRDNVTGLIWENKTDDGSIHDKDNTYDWYSNAQNIFIKDLNSTNFGGFSDWRLPTIKELSFLLNMDGYDPAINTTYFLNTVESLYWSSTPSASWPFISWLVDFHDGSIYSPSALNTSSCHVRAVRGGQCGSFDNFIDNGDGTVTETETGLMWQKDTAPGIYTWQKALSYCESLTLAEYNDWRLPNSHELLSLVDCSRLDPCIATIYFPNTVSSWYWSSTTCASDPRRAWYVDFHDGSMYIEPYVWRSEKSYYGHYVRAVRGGHSDSVNPPCPVESLYGEHSEKAEFLRYLRDSILSTTPEGQEIIRLYYEWSPVIVEMMNEDEEFKAQVKEMIMWLCGVFDQLINGSL